MTYKVLMRVILRQIPQPYNIRWTHQTDMGFIYNIKLTRLA